MTIQVTQEDIDNGIKSNCRRCTIALAMSRSFGKEISVGNTIWSAVDYSSEFGTLYKEIEPKGDLPTLIQAFIIAHDRGLLYDPKPFSFDIDI